MKLMALMLKKRRGDVLWTKTLKLWGWLTQKRRKHQKSLRSSAKKKWFLLHTLEPEKVSASWGGASQVEAYSGEFRVDYFLFLIDHFILLAAASQEALGLWKEPAGLLPGSNDRPADVLHFLWAKMLPFNNNLLDKSPVRKKTESNIADDWAGWLPEPPSRIPFFTHTHHGGDGVEPGERWTWILEWTAEGALVGEKNTTHLNSLRASQEGLQYFFCSKTLPSFATNTCK